MPLTTGTKLGPYEIVAPLGAGGMGEVFRARDTRLGREVAIKVVPQHLSDNPEVRARFEREAKTVSSLNHPHICTLFDVGREAETDYLVMELVEGETLAHRLEKGALPATEVLRLGGQIADALDRAHRAGVVHRDLKPGNVMLTKSGAKLMDFGLARTAGLAGPAGGSGASIGSLTRSPTVAQPLTAEGTIIGTFQYMAPEQLEGGETDARSDLWALGCVLYEMATGRRAFDGKSQASLISSIMSSQPAPLSQVAPLSPPGLERLVQACLAKDPADRLQSAHDIRIQLSWIAEGGSQAGVSAPVAVRRKSRERLAWGAAAVLLVVAVTVLAWSAVGLRRHEPGAVQATLKPPEDVSLTSFACNVALSPDGRAVAFNGFDSLGAFSLWIRPLASDRARKVPGTTRAGFWPFWSPDGKFIAYFDQLNGKLLKIPADGDRPTVVCDAYQGRGGTWNRNGTIVFAPATEGPLVRVTAAGGTPSFATALDTTRHETAHRFPCFLPDGDHFLFAALPGGPEGWDICVGSLRSREVRRLMSARSAAVYAEPGYLLFERDGRVMAQRFDPGRLVLDGEPTPIADAPEPSGLEAEPVVSVSRNQRLALLRSVPPDTRIEVRDRAGATLARYDLPPGPWSVLSVSPDGRAATVLNGEDIWILDLVRSIPMRFASISPTDVPAAKWSPDGARIAFVKKYKGREEVHVANLDGRSEPVLTNDASYKYVSDWSQDGRFIVFGSLDTRNDWDLWLLDTNGEHPPSPFSTGVARESYGSVSPDGRWLAYASNETGRSEIYLQSFPVPGRKMRVSPDGGEIACWAGSGRELLYQRGQEFFSVTVNPGAEPSPGIPKRLLTLRPEVTSTTFFGDGQRFLASVAIRERPRDIRLILDWTALLTR